MASQTRVAVRVVLLDAISRVLLLEGRDLSDGTDVVRFWFTVGGGVDEGETLIDAAGREVLEETGPPVRLATRGPIPSPRARLPRPRRATT